jgi:hypothetical protein
MVVEGIAVLIEKNMITCFQSTYAMHICFFYGISKRLVEMDHIEKQSMCVYVSRVRACVINAT